MLDAALTPSAPALSALPKRVKHLDLAKLKREFLFEVGQEDSDSVKQFGENFVLNEAPGALTRLGPGSIQVARFGRQIELRRNEPLTADELAQLPTKQEAYEQIPSAHDAFGNLYCRYSDEHREVAKGYQLVVRYSIPLALAHRHPSEIRLDLTPLGPDYRGAVLKTHLQMPAEQRAQHVAPYKIYHHPEVEIAGKDIRAVATAVRDVEMLFGFAPGSRVNAVYLAPQPLQTSADFRTPKLLVVWSGFASSAPDRDNTIAHETAHMIDMSLNQALSQGAVETLFASISARSDTRFFDQLNEESFFKGLLRPLPNELTSGHSEQNSFEMFGTFLATLYHPRWAERMSQMDAQFRTDYRSLLEAVESNVRALQSRRLMPANVPLLDLLRERRQALAAMEPSPNSPGAPSHAAERN